MKPSSFVAGVMAALAGVAWIATRVRDRRLARRRPIATSDAFTALSRQFGADTDLFGLAYRRLQTYTTVADFPVSPDDDLRMIYGLVDDDLVDAIQELADECGLRRPDDSQIHGLVNVRDLLHLLAGLKPKTS